jgi:eukaryotic-like serine/threonine-protein kinase
MEAYDAELHLARLRRDVAIKFVRGDAPGAVDRLVAEARAQARVSHDRVCKVYEVGEIAGEVYIAMQYIDGSTLVFERSLGHDDRPAYRGRALEGAGAGGSPSPRPSGSFGPT